MSEIDLGANRVAVVVGANSPLGAVCADHLERYGWSVWRTHHRPVDAPGRWVHCDVTDVGSVTATFEHVEAAEGAPAAVVYAAGAAERNLVLRMPSNGFADVVSVNLLGAFHVVQRAATGMVPRRAGSIIVVSSVAALWGPPGLGSYAAGKSGQIGLVRSAARELGRRGIRVNLVAPGLLDNAADRVGDAEDWRRSTPLGRFGTLNEAASVVAFLASDGARAITGAVIAVDGGFAIGAT